MSGRPSIPAKEIRGTKAALDEFTRCIMAVPRSAIQPTLDAEKAKRTSKRASRASAVSPKRAN